MSRLILAALALCAVVAAVSGEPAPGGHPHHVRAWLHKKGAQLRQWGHHEKLKAQAQWRKTVVPKMLQLRKKLGAEWQKKSPLIAAALKRQAGVFFNKALQFVNQQIARGH